MSGWMRARFLVHGALVVMAVGSAGAAFGGHPLALQTSDVSCPSDGTDFFVSCGNGTVTDNRSGLVWMANADCFGEMSWIEATAVVAGLGDMPANACGGMEADECDCGLSDHSSPGEWRLPSMAEWKAMIASGWDADECEPAINNDHGNGCWEPQCVAAGACSFYEVQAAPYWSSSVYVAQAELAWLGDLADASLGLLDRGGSARVWPVRGGQ